MPYISQVARSLYEWLEEVEIPTVDNPGDLNYVITRIADFAIGPDINYAAINTVIGTLECVKAELYRRVAAAYEDGKIDINGDVYYWTLGDGDD